MQQVLNVERSNANLRNEMLNMRRDHKQAIHDQKEALEKEKRDLIEAHEREARMNGEVKFKLEAHMK